MLQTAERPWASHIELVGQAYIHVDLWKTGKSASGSARPCSVIPFDIPHFFESATGTL